MLETNIEENHKQSRRHTIWHHIYNVGQTGLLNT